MFVGGIRAACSKEEMKLLDNASRKEKMKFMRDKNTWSPKAEMFWNMHLSKDLSEMSASLITLGSQEFLHLVGHRKQCCKFGCHSSKSGNWQHFLGRHKVKNSPNYFQRAIFSNDDPVAYGAIKWTCVCSATSYEQQCWNICELIRNLFGRMVGLV